jgi:acylphosphatase
MAAAERQLRAKLIISGRVQGVWFRGTTVEMARPLGLTGYVRNRSDGRVEAVFEGAESNVRRAVTWCHHGPRSASVESVDVTWGEPTGEYGGFSTRY